MADNNKAELADQAMQWLQRRERQRQEIAEGRRLPSQGQPEPAEDGILDEDIMEEEDIGGRQPARGMQGTRPVAKARAEPTPAGMLRVSAPKGYAAAVSLMQSMPQRKRPNVAVPRSIPSATQEYDLPGLKPVAKGAVRPANRAPPVRAAPPPARAAPAAAPGVQFPRDKPMAIQFPDGVEKPTMLDGMSDSSIAFSYDGKKKSLLAEVDEVLKDFLGGTDEDAGVQCSEGSNMLQDSWEKFPDVGIALSEVSRSKECFCIVTSPQHGLWGVGVQEKGSMRWYAARVALAVGLASQAMEEGEDVDLSGVPTFEALVQSYTGNAAKRARA